MKKLIFGICPHVQEGTVGENCTYKILCTIFVFVQNTKYVQSILKCILPSPLHSKALIYHILKFFRGKK